MSSDYWEFIRSSDTTVLSSLDTTSVDYFGVSPTSIADGSEPQQLEMSAIMARAREIVRSIELAQRSDIATADRALEEIAHKEGYASYPLYYVAVTGDFRNDIRAVAARLFIGSLYRKPSLLPRRQTRAELDWRAGQLVKHLAQSVPPLVRLGVLDALDEANDFRMIRKMFAPERDARVREMADKVLEEE